MKNVLLYSFLFTCMNAFSQTYSLQIVNDSLNASLRGISIANDSVIWVSGSKGYYGRSIDGGMSWMFAQVPGYDSAEFRDIESFDAYTSVIMSSVSPACILRTTDGGKTWTEVFRDNRPSVFLDAIDFYGNNPATGICIGDPIDSNFFMLETKDGGIHWRDASIKDPAFPPGMFAFAASGTCIQILSGKELCFVTGGSDNNLYFASTSGRILFDYQDGIFSGGKESQGLFSVDFIDQKRGMICGGDYADPLSTPFTFAYTKNRGKSWKIGHSPMGYVSCVKMISKNLAVICGPNGVGVVDIHTMGCTMISTEGFHTISVTPDKRTIYLSGPNGRVARLLVN